MFPEGGFYISRTYGPFPREIPALRCITCVSQPLLTYIQHMLLGATPILSCSILGGSGFLNCNSFTLWSLVPGTPAQRPLLLLLL